MDASLDRAPKLQHCPKVGAAILLKSGSRKYHKGDVCNRDTVKLTIRSHLAHRARTKSPPAIRCCTDKITKLTRTSPRRLLSPLCIVIVQGEWLWNYRIFLGLFLMKTPMNNGDKRTNPARDLPSNQHRSPQTTAIPSPRTA